MSADSMCRVCLVGNKNLYSVRNDLQSVYESIAREKYNKVGYPVHMCYICLTVLQKCQRFMETARDNNNVLKQWYNQQNEMRGARPLFTYSTSKVDVVSTYNGDISLKHEIKVEEVDLRVDEVQTDNVEEYNTDVDIENTDLDEQKDCSELLVDNDNTYTGTIEYNYDRQTDPLYNNKIYFEQRSSIASTLDDYTNIETTIKTISPLDNGQAEIIKKLDALHADVNDVKVSLASLQQQQNMNTIKIMTMLDNMNKHFQKAPEMRTPAGSALDDDDILKKYALPLDNLTILKDLDRDLSQEKYFTSMVKHFSSFVGADGQGRGEILGKKMAEQIMTRDLMTKMSWTGVSRTVEFQRKFAFQTLENVVKLFHNVLLKADSRWSHEKNEKLFSGALLKHAKKRAIAEKEKAEKKKKTFEVGDNLTRVDNNTATSSNISATEAQEKSATRESSVDEDTE